MPTHRILSLLLVPVLAGMVAGMAGCTAEKTSDGDGTSTTAPSNPSSSPANAVASVITVTDNANAQDGFKNANGAVDAIQKIGELAEALYGSAPATDARAIGDSRTINLGTSGIPGASGTAVITQTATATWRVQFTATCSLYVITLLSNVTFSANGIFTVEKRNDGTYAVNIDSANPVVVSVAGVGGRAVSCTGGFTWRKSSATSGSTTTTTLTTTANLVMAVTLPIGTATVTMATDPDFSVSTTGSASSATYGGKVTVRIQLAAIGYDRTYQYPQAVAG